MRERISNIKKRMVAVGMTIALCFGMIVPAYADDPYEIGYVDLAGENVSFAPTPASDWCGTYEVDINGVSYGIEIAPYWDNPDIWSITAIAICYDSGTDERTYWSGDVMLEDPMYYTTGVGTVSNGDVTGFSWGTLDNGAFNTIDRPNTMEGDFDLSLQKYKGETTGLTYLDVFQEGFSDYGITSGGVPNSAFGPSTYTKISDSYGVTFTDWVNSPIPSWYWDMISGGDPVIVNWQIQSNTPTGQAPIDRLGPAIYDWYYSDGSGVG